MAVAHKGKLFSVRDIAKRWRTWPQNVVDIMAEVEPYDTTAAGRIWTLAQVLRMEKKRPDLYHTEEE